LEQLLPESRKDEHQKEQHQLLMSLQNQEHIYSVAWNAANEYFNRIAEKIDNSPIKSPNIKGNDPIGSTNIPIKVYEQFTTTFRGGSCIIP